MKKRFGLVFINASDRTFVRFNGLLSTRIVRRRRGDVLLGGPK